MARSRNIKPALMTNEDLADNEPLGRLLFVYLTMLADCKGNIEWRPKRIKVQALPYDNCDIEKLTINLDKSGFIRFYSDGEKIYINIVNFLAHQNPHKNERDKGSSIPEYSDRGRQLIDLTRLTINPDKNGTNPEPNGTDPADSLIPHPDSLILIAEGKPHESVINDWQPSDATLDVLRKIHGVPDQFILETVAEFILYWSDRNEPRASWNSKFLTNCNSQWMKRKNEWTKSNRQDASKDSNGRLDYATGAAKLLGNQ